MVGISQRGAAPRYHALGRTLNYVYSTICTTVTYVIYVFSYALARDSQDGLRIEFLYREFLAKVLTLLESQDLMFAG